MHIQILEQQMLADLQKAVWKYTQIILRNIRPIQLRQRLSWLATEQLNEKDTTRSTWLGLMLQHAAFNINQSINQSINHKALSSRATSRLKSYGYNAVRQSMKDRSDDEVWIRLSEEPCLEMLTEW